MNTPASIEAETPLPYSWMEGCWASDDHVEHWHRGGPDLLFGSNVLLKNGEVAFFEHMRIERVDEGFAFFAYPRGIGPHQFNALGSVEATATTAVFVNSEHDYPQRIAYTREGNALLADISLVDGSKVNSWRFEACDAR